ncbi:MAG: signal peptidase I [Planctomycetota bacterium]|jgi:signal peptidase I
MSRKKKKKKPALPPAPAARKEGEKESGVGKRMLIREHVEAVVGVVIVILVLRHFCLGNYQIPTSSMEPTLFGNHPEERIRGDRILVDRLAYLTGEPKRWDTIVFKYPLDRTKTYIKRLIALPGEQVRIRGGNIFINREPKGFPPRWFLARKPPAVQREIWQGIYPRCRTETPGTWAPVDGASFEGTPREGILKAGKEGEGWLDFRGRLQARVPKSLASLPSPPLGEIRLVFEAALDAGALHVDLDLTARRIGFRLPVGAGDAEIRMDGETVARGPTPLRAGRAVRLAFENVDGVLTLEGSGAPPITHTYDPAGEGREVERPRLRIGVSDGGTLRLRKTAIFRDIHYIEDSKGVLRRYGHLRVHEDGYFVLGDNCPRSKDSRLWRSVTYRLKNGREITGEMGGDEYARDEETGEIRFLDHNGNRWRFSRDELENFDDAGTFAPFVPRDRIVGRAFMVYWPLPRLRLIPRSPG